MMTGTESAGALSLETLRRPEVLADPYPFYRRLQAEAPVLWDEEGGSWVVSRYADVVALLRDPRLTAERILPEGSDDPTVNAVAHALSRQMLFLDPPDHTRLRGLVNKAFTPRRIKVLRPLIESLVDDLLDGAAAAGGMDVVADFAFPLPAIVIAGMLGVPADDRDRLKEWSRDFGLLISGTPLTVEQSAQAQLGVMSMVGYFAEIADQRRADPRDDLLSALLAAEEQGDRLSTEELLVNCLLLFAAGHGTTTHLIGNSVLALLAHPDQLARMRADPALIVSGIDELLRFDGPVQVTGRGVMQDLEVAGTRVAAGQHVTMVLGAANRDPLQFSEPDRLDLGRRDIRHVAFGHGIHFCLGAALARLEGQIALGTLVGRFPSLRLDTTSAALPRMQGIVFRGVEALPVSIP